MSNERRLHDDDADSMEAARASGKDILALQERPREMSAAEEQSSADQWLLQMLMDETPNFVAIKDHEGRFLLASRSLAAFFGTSPEEMVGKDVGDVSASLEQAEFFRQDVKAIMACETIQVTFEEFNDGKTNESRHFKSIKKPFAGPDGQARILVIYQDITDIRQEQARVEVDHKRLAHIQEATRDGIWDWDIPSGRARHNRRWFEILGYSPDELTGTLADFHRVLHPDDVADVITSIESALAGDGIYRHQHRMICKDGRTIWVLDLGRVVERDGQGRPTRMVGSFVDITGHKAAEQQLAESEERFRRLFEDTRQPLSLLEDGRFVAVNRATLEMLRLTSFGQLIGRTPGDVSPAHQPDGRASTEKAGEMIQTAFELGFHEFEWEHVRADGEHFPAKILLTPIRHNGRDLMHVTWRDVTELKRSHAQIEYMAYHDSLTGLPNRALGQKLLSETIERAQRGEVCPAVLYLDLDRFKYINDTHGHQMGDELLKAVAIRLQSQILDGGQVCRLSGDEFMLVFGFPPRPDVFKDAFEQCSRLLKSMELPFELDDIRLSISSSTGCAIYPRDGTDANALMRNAHTALYYAKQAGPGSHRIFEQAMNDDLRRFVEMREALRLALERDEFELHYQPQIDLRTRRIIGVEALIRWQRPGFGLVMPGDFIGVAEESGLILAIGRWVLWEACRQGAVWAEQGWSDLSIGVNLSPVQFREGQLGEEVCSALQSTGLNPKSLELELTESTLLSHQESVSSMLASWRALGIRLAIDDFGTGYASLAYLKRFKTDKIKIDRSFVQNLLTDDEDRTIVQAVIQVARGFNMRTIAEGVETFELTQELASLGCDEVQGYVYSRPLPPDAFAEWLRAAHVMQ